MDLKTLQMFSTLARLGSIRRTAEMLGTSPTAITRALDKLEHSFGTPLVDRGPSGVRLTTAGELLADRSDHIGQEFNRIKQTIAELKGLSRGSVSLCISGATAGAILAPALAEFSQLHSEISIVVKVASAQSARDAVAQGSADIAVNMFSQPDTRLETRYRMDVRHEPVMAPSHPLAELDRVTIADLVRHPLALPDSSFDIRLALDARLRSAGIVDYQPAYTTAALELQIAIAQRGVAVLILPEMAVQPYLNDGSLMIRPFSPEARITTMLDLCHSTTRPQNFAARRFLEFLESFLKRTFGEGSQV